MFGVVNMGEPRMFTLKNKKIETMTLSQGGVVSQLDGGGGGGVKISLDCS